MTWRYLAQRALTGTWLDRDLPLDVDELSWTLSGPTSLRATVDPDVGHLRAADGSLLLDPWSTILYAEADGEIRAGAIVTRSEWTGPVWEVEATGFSGYPHGIPYLGFYSQTSVDPADAFRAVWAEVQGVDGGNLGVVVDPLTTPVRLGTVEEPYELRWWEAPDCGEELDTLAQITPFDYVEHHAWDGDDVVHRLQLGYPRLGRRRFDLAFVQGDNVTSVVQAAVEGDDIANEVLGIGAGEGREAVHGRIAVRDGRLRRPTVWTDKMVSDPARLDALIRLELEARRPVLDISDIDVIDHPNAAIGTWQLGDDILVQATLPWIGDLSIWCRVVGWSLLSETRARLHLRRSDFFT